MFMTNAQTPNVMQNHPKRKSTERKSAKSKLSFNYTRPASDRIAKTKAQDIGKL